MIKKYIRYYYMNILDILIIVIVMGIFYKFYIDNPKKILENELTQETFKSDVDYAFLDDYVDKMYKAEKKEKQYINPYFMENQFHQDYTDTNNAFLGLIPNQRQLFNRSDLPLIKTSTPNNKEVYPLLKTFIRSVNKSVDKNNDNNNWKNNSVEKQYKDGFEEHQMKLGLPPSIYNKPLQKEHVKLLKLDHAEKFETEDEIRYVLFIIIQKPSAKDQMLVKVSFYIDKQDTNLDRDFFDSGKNDSVNYVKIEEIFIVGFLTAHSFGKHSVKTDYYNFNGISNGRMFSEKEIVKELNKKRKQYESECVK